MNSCILSKEDILCMQYAGMKASQIMTPKLMPEEYAEAFEAYIDKAESVMSMQEEYGVITLENRKRLSANNSLHRGFVTSCSNSQSHCRHRCTRCFTNWIEKSIRIRK